ncbi:MAG: DegT/DnrJ/EryC1/StrS family aminotransferase [Nitrospira sp.]
MSDTDVPFFDLVTVHRELEDELVEVFRAALRTAGFIGGPTVLAFEEEFARFCQASHCVGAGSGTDALRFALISVGVQQGDIVLTVPNTFIATAEAISQAGARPDFIDIDASTYTMDPAKLREYLTTQCSWNGECQRTTHKQTGRPVTAVVPVHLYGQMADMDAIFDVSAQFNLKVIEDACQAQGAEYYSKKDEQWHRAGSLGHAAAFSFYPGKNLGACGEAGAITTNDDQIAQASRLLRDHGQSKKYFHDIEGYNGRLDAIQAGFLRVKLRRLNGWNDQRREIAERYTKLLAGSGNSIGFPEQPNWSRSVYHQYVVQVSDRAGVQQRLGKAGIGTGIHYPIPLHLTQAYRGYGFHGGDFPVAEQAANQILSLPMFPGLTPPQQERVVAELVQAVTES